VFDVRDHGRKHKALIWSGTAFNFGRDLPRLDNYIAQTERMRSVARRAGVDLPLSNHPGYDGTVAKLRARSGNAMAPSPFVAGSEVVDRTLRVMGECARAQKSRFLLPS
jgi:metallo-beta-lactamase class B